MEYILDAFKWVIKNYETVIAALIAIVTALISIFILIPGEQPEKFLQEVLNFLKKISRK